MSNVRENSIQLPCSNEQRADAERRAAEAGLSLPNFLRQLLGWELEQHGRRKDLLTKDTANKSMDVRQKQ
jgi:hypothetical protein